MIRMRAPFVAWTLMTVSGCANDPSAALGSGEAPTKSQIRATLLTSGKADDGNDVCAQYGWYGDGECDDFCPRRDNDCASDERTPELGDDPAIALRSNVWMSEALAQAEAAYGPTIEAKFELGDDGEFAKAAKRLPTRMELSLSVYPAAEGAKKDAERNRFEELAGDPTGASWTPGVQVFADAEHLTRSARDLTLVQLSKRSLSAVVANEEWFGFVYWAVPTIHEGHAGYGIYTLLDDADQDGDASSAESVYTFVDGGGSRTRQVKDLGAGPGSGATDARTPELGGTPAIIRSAHISLAEGVAQVEREHGAVIEAKFELDDDGKLSLSVYPVGKGLATDAERNTFFEVAGDPTAAKWTPEKTQFAVPDAEHLTRAARDLTIIQAASLTLGEAIRKAEAKVKSGLAYWAIPTVRGTRGGFGIYVLGPNGKSHYFFVS